MDQPKRYSLGTLIAVSFAIAIACGATGLMTGALGSQILGPTVTAPSTAEPPQEPPELTANAVVASRDIRIGTTIDEWMLTTVPYPAEYLLETMIVDPSSIVGQTARVDITRGTVLTRGLLVESAPGLSATVVVAVYDIPAGTTIDEEMVTTMPFPLDYAFETMIFDLSSVVGRTARVEIRRGMIFTQGLLADR